jgi:predicted Zn-dependent protease
MERRVLAFHWAMMAMGTISFLGMGCGNATLWSKQEEIRIGRQVAEEIEKEYEVSKNPADIALVEGIGQRIVWAAQSDWPYTFKVLEHREVNAISLPGGPVYIFRGLIDLTKGNEDELAAVIAHEVAHVHRRHVAKMYAKGVFADLVIIFATGGALQDAAQIANLMLQLRFSRDDEYEADRLALRYTYRAGYDPHGLIRFFEKLLREQKEEKTDILVYNLTRTHPLTEARIKRAKEELSKIIKEVNAEVQASGAKLP